MGSASLSRSSPVGSVALKAHNEGVSVPFLVVELEGTHLNDVTLALPDTMLAGKAVSGSVACPSGVAIGVDTNVSNLVDVSSIDSLLEASKDKSKTIWAQRLRIELNQHPIVVGNHAGKAESQDSDEHEMFHSGIINNDLRQILLGVDMLLRNLAEQGKLLD